MGGGPVQSAGALGHRNSYFALDPDHSFSVCLGQPCSGHSFPSFRDMARSLVLAFPTARPTCHRAQTHLARSLLGMERPGNSGCLTGIEEEKVLEGGTPKV